MLQALYKLEPHWGPLRLFRYLSFRMLMALFTSVIIGFLIAGPMRRYLCCRGMEQAQRTAREVHRLAELHAAKEHTPTMGGLLIFFSTLSSAFLWVRWNTLVGLSLLVYVALTLLGFGDDFLKISHRSSHGLPWWLKMAIQGLLTALVLAVLWAHSPEWRQSYAELCFPFFKHPLLSDLPGWLVGLFFFCVLSGTSNAINLTDGIDGLATGCALMTILFFTLMAYLTGNALVASYLHLSPVSGSGELAVLCAALAGACLVFLWYNAHPAEIFMGDTGSLAIGGLVGTIAFLVKQPFLLVLVGAVFVAETLSVILQVASFRWRGGRRVLRMAPLHHHFELSGIPEPKLVVRFWIVSFLCLLLGLATLKLR
ncbi:MAG: phospho-N-acetylmuramoyl-pentapeptide-transferase [Puniceicoccales bacterium]|jgi:phospho-N-acetylmuramoyl-pentapeptide-transferase|nr:phospho-N-acetylmuramoyl-pentapeptide-transferase [Puniceicoccales bacterium]